MRLDFYGASKWVRVATAVGASVPLKRILEVIGEADAELAGKMVVNVTCYHADVGPKGAFFTPPGFLVFEAAFNRKYVIGMRLSTHRGQQRPRPWKGHARLGLSPHLAEGEE